MEIKTEEKFEATKRMELMGIFTNDRLDDRKYLLGRTLRGNDYGNLKNGGARGLLGAGVLWSSLNF